MTDEETPAAAPETVSKQEFEELKGAVTGLTSALEELRTATPSEKPEAQREVADRKADLKDLAKELGIDPKRLEQAADNARREQRKEELRPLLVELLDEELAEDLEDAIGDVVDGAKGNGEAKDAPEPKEDSEPVAEHWSEGAIGNLLGLGGRK